MKPKKKKLRIAKPKRSYRAALKSIRQVLKVSAVKDDSSVSLFGQPSKEFLPATDLRIAVWNICKGAGSNAFRHELQMLMQASDLVLLQEALLSEALIATLINPSFVSLHGASYVRKDGIRDGVLTMSRVPALGPAQRVLCKAPEPFLKTAKTALITTFPIAGMSSPLIVVNLHARLIRSVKGSIAELRHLIEQLPQTDSPMVLAGDFNTFTKTYLKATAKELGSLGLQMVEIVDDPRSRLQHLDHVFVRGLQVKRAHVDTTMRNSDHFPLVLTFDTGLPR